MADTENTNQGGSAGIRLRRAVMAGLKAGLSSCLFLLKIIIPVSLGVSLLNYFGILPWLARFITPVMGWIGLRGEAALVFVTSLLLNNYSAIAVIQTLEFTGREISILAVMCLIAHNLPVETTVMRKAGSSGLRMVLLRIGMALLAAWLLNLVMPDTIEVAFVSRGPAGDLAFLPFLLDWLRNTLVLILKIIVFVFALMVGQRLLDEFRVTVWLSRLFAPLLRVFGLPPATSLLWIVVNTLGYAYGAAVIMEQVRGGSLKPQDADLFNHHAAVCHSLLEDTLLWFALGVSLLWLVPPRLVLALLVVWLERYRRSHFRYSLKAGSL